MSVVCCKISEKTIEVAADSISIRGYTQSKGKDDYSKLVEINGMIVGCVGRAEESSLLQMFCATRTPESASEGAILTFFTEFMDWKKKRTEKYKTENRFIFVFTGKAFYVEGFFIREIKSYEAIGAGMNFGLSALYLGHSAAKAVETACELSIFCEQPIQILKATRQ
ncbi:MAG: hypothetical protein Q9M28_01840 [Mariprofundaceae bacterium]|nr:hypothetical protein [Mariprofundaceae bacterium]